MEELDEITARFYGAFTSEGSARGIDTLYDLFRNDAHIIKAVESAQQAYDVAGFVEPRRELLTNGRISSFREWETDFETRVFGNIAQRFSRYRKTWVEAGKRCEGGGVKSLHFVRGPEGWKLAHLIWDDET